MTRHKGRGSGFGDNPLRKHGRRSGYTDYRYGTPATEPKSRPIYNPAQRDHLIEDVAAVLSKWTSSKWEREGDTRAGLRSALCLDGYAWRRSDDEAARLIEGAFKALGATDRPTFAEGQPGYTLPPETCLWCSGPITDPDITRGQKFCSVECARLALDRRYTGANLRMDAVRAAAYSLIAKRRSKPRPCAHCGELFQSARETTVHCSTACSNAAKRMPDRDCEECGKGFHPERAEQRYCSVSCAGKAKVEAIRSQMSERHCDCCDAVYRPAVESQRYCSEGCRKRVENMLQRVRKGNARFSPVVFDYYVTLPINMALAA